jgi:chemotaxis protein histidine kinase CheA
MEINETILKTVRQIQENQDNLDRDLTKDRQDIQNLNIKVETLISEMAETRRAINLNAERVKQKTSEAIEPITEATQNLASKIAKSKTVIFGEKLNWFQRLVREFRKEIK